MTVLDSFRQRTASVIAGGCFCVAACGSEKSEPGTIVVGIIADDLGGAVSELTLSIDIESTRERVATVPITALPYELRLEPRPGGSPIGMVNVSVEGHGASGDAVVIRRLASTRFMEGRIKLLRMRLEAECLAPKAPSCSATQTCTSGRCVHNYLPPEDLEFFDAAWAVDRPDACHSGAAGAVELSLGTGQSGYEPLLDGQALKLEKGPQGGHHLWFSLLVKNLKQSGTKITLSAIQPDSGVTVPPTAFVLAFDPTVDGRCETHGLRYQLDNGAADYRSFWGKRLDVTAEVRDAWGRSGTITRSIAVASGD